MHKTLEQLSEHLEKIYFSILKGFNRAISFLDQSDAYIGKTARAGIIREYVLDEIQDVFPKECISNNGSRLKLLLINGIAIRFKKVDRNSKAGNIPTNQALAFASQMQVPGVSSTLNLNAGWQLDESGTTIKKISLIKPESLSENGWTVNLGQYLANKNSIFEIPILQDVAIQQPFENPIEVFIKPEAAEKRIRNEEKYG